MAIKLPRTLAAAVVVSGLGATQAGAITLELIDTYVRSGPFGLAFDGTNIWWSQNNAQINQMTLAGVDTGVTFAGPVWSELAWNGSQLLSAQNTTIYAFDAGTGANQTTQTLLASPFTGITNLIDGFDFDNDEYWLSPDIGNVYRAANDLASFVGASPFLGGGGGYSGVERIQASSQDYVVVVNDASNPRQLCVHELDATLVGCQQFANARYEGLAFDGRYVWAADYFGNKIDKYDILGDDGGSIIVPGGVVPLPATAALLISGAAGLGALRLRRRS